MKTLPCRFFYDARGSELFEEITRLPEYYPTRTEAAILQAHAAEMAEGLPAGGILVEFGSGSSLKTEILLRQLPQLGAYVCIDVSESALAEATARLTSRFPTLDVRPIVGDFARTVTLPADLADRPRTGFFPGSTIGNLTPAEAASLLQAFDACLGAGGRLIVGVDLKKDARRLHMAYNDARGVTAAFNLNLLARINRELAGTFDVAAFRHEAVYNPREGRIEMHLRSTRRQTASVLGRTFHFGAGDASTRRIPTSTPSPSSRIWPAPPAGNRRGYGPIRTTFSACTSWLLGVRPGVRPLASRFRILPRRSMRGV